MDILEQTTAWVDEVTLQPLSTQRFGNLAFRDYIKLVDHVSIGVCLSPLKADGNSAFHIWSRPSRTYHHISSTRYSHS